MWPVDQGFNQVNVCIHECFQHVVGFWHLEVIGIQFFHKVYVCVQLVNDCWSDPRLQGGFELPTCLDFRDLETLISIGDKFVQNHASKPGVAPQLVKHLRKCIIKSIICLRIFLKSQ